MSLKGALTTPVFVAPAAYVIRGPGLALRLRP
jgi:hypothetical protein